MKKLFFVISLLIYTASFTQQINHPDYFEKYWTPSAGFVTTDFNNYYVFACTSLIATDSTYVGAGSLGLSAGWDRKTYAFSIQEQWKYYNWDQITEENDPNRNFNIWNLDLSFRWRFAPGSEASLLYRNQIFNSDNQATLGYTESLNKLFKQAVQNTISLRVTYFLDYNNVAYIFNKK